MKVAILTINIGKYFCFLESFYHNNNKNFLPDCEKDFIVFTDQKRMLLKKRVNNIVHAKTKNYGWPYNTLFRFAFFESIKEKLEEYDYVFFFNSNLNFFKEINITDLFTNGITDYTFCKHPVYYTTTNGNLFNYERRTESTAYIPFGTTGLNYIMGGIYGAKPQKFIEMCNICHKNIVSDMKKKIIAIWHDESHINKFFIDIKDKTNVNLLGPDYAYAPDCCNFLKNYQIKGLLIPKQCFGGHDELRKNNNTKDDIRFSDKNVRYEFFIEEAGEKYLIKATKYICINAYLLNSGILVKYSPEEIQIVWDNAGLSIYKFDKTTQTYK